MKKRTTYTTLLLILVTCSCFSQSFGVKDSFDDNKYGWWEKKTDTGSAAIQDGKYIVEMPEDGWLLSIAPYVEYEKDFTAEISFRQMDGHEDNGVGIIWGYNKVTIDENHFTISANGSFFVSNITADRPTNKEGVRKWTASKLIKPLGQLNTLTVKQVAGTLHFFINHEEVFSTQAFPWAASRVGIVAFTKMTLEVEDFSFIQEGIKLNLPPTLTTGFVKENLGPAINTTADDLIPRISADGRILYFGRENYEGNIGGVDDGEDFYFSTLVGTEWGQAQNMGDPINTKDVNNICSISTDNNTIYYIHDSKFWSRSRSESGWGEPEEIGVSYTNDANHFEACLAADGKAFLFTIQNSNNLFYNKQGEEERDIYVSIQAKDNTWSAPINLGPTVNTRGDEYSPFLAADGRTLYYSTYGLPGYGGGDVFMTKRIGDGWTKWSAPVNLGPEINSIGFDAYYVLPASGDYAYMVSSLNGYGKTDIVRIKLPKELKPNPVVLVRGKTLDAKTKKPISADVLIANLLTNVEVGEAISDPKTGDFQIVLPYGTNYGFHAAAPGHLSVSENLDLITVNAYTEIEKNLYLLPITVGQTIQLNNVFFEQAKSILKTESYPELDRLVDIMKENPTMEIELGGYTDNIGKEVPLIVLSQDRVGTVKKYMMGKGIPSKRITGKGYGPANPIAKNDTEEHRKMNRRVEFKVTKK